MSKKDLVIVLVLLITAPLSVARSADFDTSRLLEASFSADCLDWTIDGVCAFLQCGLFGCRIVVTPRISHRLPDLVAQSYGNTGEAPWRAWMPILDQALTNAPAPPISAGEATLTGGAGSGAGPHRFTDTLQFFETDVAGNPVAAAMSVSKFLCRTDVTPMRPYFVSVSDAPVWRGWDAEHERARPESVTPGLREIGAGSGNWGSVFPRIGFLLQADAARAAAVTSARAIDIVISDSDGRSVIPYRAADSVRHVLRGDPTATNPRDCTDSGGEWAVFRGDAECKARMWRQWRAAPTDSSTNWQLITPDLDSSCRAFGGPRSPCDVALDGKYAWQYWVRYQCCMSKGSFLGVF